MTRYVLMVAILAVAPDWAAVIPATVVEQLTVRGDVFVKINTVSNNTIIAWDRADETG